MISRIIADRNLNSSLLTCDITQRHPISHKVLFKSSSSIFLNVYENIPPDLAFRGSLTTAVIILFLLLLTGEILDSITSFVQIGQA